MIDPKTSSKKDIINFGLNLTRVDQLSEVHTYDFSINYDGAAYWLVNDKNNTRSMFTSLWACYYELVSLVQIQASTEDRLGLITIANVKAMDINQLSDPNVFWVARWSSKLQMQPSALKNPYKMGPDKDGDRNQVIELFRKHLWSEFKKGKHSPAFNLLKRMARLVKMGQDITLVCYCYPLQCHADVIKSALLYLIKEGKI